MSAAMGARRLRELVGIADSLIATFMDRTFCLSPDKAGRGCIAHALRYPTRRAKHQMRARGRKVVAFADLDPFDLCSACHAEHAARVAGIMAGRALEYAAG